MHLGRSLRSAGPAVTEASRPVKKYPPRFFTPQWKNPKFSAPAKPDAPPVPSHYTGLLYTDFVPAGAKPVTESKHGNSPFVVNRIAYHKQLHALRKSVRAGVCVVFLFFPLFSPLFLLFLPV